MYGKDAGIIPIIITTITSITRTRMVRAGIRSDFSLPEFSRVLPSLRSTMSITAMMTESFISHPTEDIQP